MRWCSERLRTCPGAQGSLQEAGLALTSSVPNLCQAEGHRGGPEGVPCPHPQELLGRAEAGFVFQGTRVVVLTRGWVPRPRSELGMARPGGGGGDAARVLQRMRGGQCGAPRMKAVGKCGGGRGLGAGMPLGSRVPSPGFLLEPVDTPVPAQRGRKTPVWVSGR